MTGTSGSKGPDRTVGTFRLVSDAPSVSGYVDREIDRMAEATAKHAGYTPTSVEMFIRYEAEGLPGDRTQRRLDAAKMVARKLGTPIELSESSCPDIDNKILEAYGKNTSQKTQK